MSICDKLALMKRAEQENDRRIAAHIAAERERAS